MIRHIVARVGEIASGQRKILEVGGRRVGVFHSNGEYFALLDRCPHQGASLCSGMLVSLIESSGPGDYRMTRPAEMLRCPWHGWEFDIRRGQSWCDPAKLRVKTHPVTVEPGAELTKGRYVATIYSVTVEDDYVLVDL
jgi:3-phenylpropionate/trans-cinnamate dioxygenase ferredoxin subunit